MPEHMVLNYQKFIHSSTKLSPLAHAEFLLLASSSPVSSGQDFLLNQSHSKSVVDLLMCSVSSASHFPVDTAVCVLTPRNFCIHLL